jgi:hypothetical protein
MTNRAKPADERHENEEPREEASDAERNWTIAKTLWELELQREIRGLQATPNRFHLDSRNEIEGWDETSLESGIASKQRPRRRGLAKAEITVRRRAIMFCPGFPARNRNFIIRSNSSLEKPIDNGIFQARGRPERAMS